MLLALAGIARAEQPLSRHVPEAVVNLNLQPAARLPGSTQLNLAIALPWRNQGELTNLLREIYDPASTNFHHYLTPQQFAERFGPAAADYEAVAAFAQSNGLTVTARHANRLLLDVSGPVEQVERVLHVRLWSYHHPKEARDFFAPDAEPSLDLSVPVLHIGGLDNYALPQPCYHVETNHPARRADAIPETGSATNGAYLGNDFRAAYIPDVTLTGTGQTVGLLEFDGYYSNDIASYENQAGLPSVTLTNVLLDGFNGFPTNTGGETEVSLDIEMAVAMAPGLSQVIVYEAGPAGSWHDMLNRMTTDDLAVQLSSSWMIGAGPADPVADQIYQQMAAQGQTMFQASGDFDAYVTLIGFPADNPYLTVVGGTTLTTSGPGGAWVSEAVWNTNTAGSGGGISTSYAIPAWQQGVSMASNQGSTTMRNIPDVALTADNVDVVARNGLSLVVGGTSCAAPLWAAFTALANQQAAASGLTPVGFLNPLVYQIGLGTNYGAAFHDIATGNNTNAFSHGKFLAVPGYDLCTGWGTPAGQNLINSILQTFQPGPVITSQPRSQTVPFNGNVGFFVDAGGQAPLSFQWYFNTTNISGATNAWLLLSNVTSAQAGTYYVLVTNAAGSALSSNAVLTVLPPIPPSVTNQPLSQSATLGGSVSFSAAATGTLPLSYQWTFNGTNLPGATNTTLALTNLQLTQAGTYAVQVTNVVNSTTSSNAILLIYPGWAVTSASNIGWASVASSADGTKLVALAAHGGIYKSGDSGTTWTPAQSGAPSTNWASVASSADGSRLVAATAHGFVYTSADFGNTWKKSGAPTNFWNAVGSSADGLKLAALRMESAGFGAGPIYISMNAGTNWVNEDIAAAQCPKTWTALAVSADLTKIAAVIDNGLIFISTNSGTSWTRAGAPTNAWSGIASSADGSKLAAVAHTGLPLCGGLNASAYTGPVYTWTGPGTNWTPANIPENDWIAIASSADGTRLAVAASNGPVYFSTNSGTTWSDSGAPSNAWTSVACSADGTRFVAASGANNGQIYLFQTVPTLGLQFSSNNLVVSWPALWNGAMLSQSTNLTPGNWVPVTNVPVLTNGQIQAMIAPSSNGSTFYRLSYP